MKRRFNYPKHFEKEKKLPRLTKKRIKIAQKEQYQKNQQEVT